jgi:hypothetical protein
MGLKRGRLPLGLSGSHMNGAASAVKKIPNSQNISGVHALLYQFDAPTKPEINHLKQQAFPRQDFEVFVDFPF